MVMLAVSRVCVTPCEVLGVGIWLCSQWEGFLCVDLLGV